MSDGHNNYKTSREGVKWFKRWGPDGRSKNWLGEDHLDTLDLASWVRNNPTVEIPYWVGFPAYGAFPSHTLGDFGFKPWQEFVTAMEETKRAFTVTWLENGPNGSIRGFINEMVPRIRLNQSVPAFTRSSLNSRILTDKPRGEWTRMNMAGKPHDLDFYERADHDGGINFYPRWEAASLTDTAERWALTLWLAKDCPSETGVMDLTPRRCQAFRAKPGDAFAWSVSDAAGKQIAAGRAIADAWGLVTVAGVTLGKDKRVLTIAR
jgi:hypothetical protein